MTTFFERLREERVRMGLNQADFGAIGGVKKDAQLKYESGKRKPDADYLEAIAAEGADVQYILTGVRSGTYTAATAEPLAISEPNARERALLENYRESTEEDRRAIERMALLSAEAQHKEAAGKPGRTK